MKTYYLAFGTQDPATYTGLTPTFTVFSAEGVTTLTPPGITETPTGSGLYRFQYEPTLSIAFVADGGGALPSADRYVVGALDPVQAVDERIGTTADSFGSTSTDPSTIYGYVRRLQEFLEGDATFDKGTGVWTISSRGSSTILRVKTLTNTISEADKS